MFDHFPTESHDEPLHVARCLFADHGHDLATAASRLGGSFGAAKVVSCAHKIGGRAGWRSVSAKAHEAHQPAAQSVRAMSSTIKKAVNQWLVKFSSGFLETTKLLISVLQERRAVTRSLTGLACRDAYHS